MRFPTRRDVTLVRDDPDLIKPRIFVLIVIFGMAHTGSGAHHLNVARAGAAGIAEAILVRDRALPDIGNDFHIVVRMFAEAASGGNTVIIETRNAPNPIRLGS